MITGWQQWLLRLLLPVPALGIFAAAAPRLNSGIVLEEIFPESAYVTSNITLSPSSYAVMAQALANATTDDGGTQILRAEIAIDAGEAPSAIIPLLEEALSRSPADARGWVLLASLLTQNPNAAGRAMSLALTLAPKEYYLIVPRTAVGAGLWIYLPEAARHQLLDDAYLIATDENSRANLYAIIGRPGGTALVTRALAKHPDKIKALNQNVARETLHLN